MMLLQTEIKAFFGYVSNKQFETQNVTSNSKSLFEYLKQ